MGCVYIWLHVVLCAINQRSKGKLYIRAIHLGYVRILQRLVHLGHTLVLAQSSPYNGFVGENGLSIG